MSQSQVGTLEGRFEKAYQELVSLLQEKHKGSSSEHGGIYTYILSSADMFTGLTLSSDGAWGGKVGMMGYEVAHSPESLAAEYAFLVDEGFNKIHRKYDLLDKEGDRAKQEYLENHYARLLEEFAVELEKVLQTYKEG